MVIRTKQQAAVGAPFKPEARYANVFRIGHNACEFLFDFGQQYESEDLTDPHTRIITGPAYAKALLETLQQAVHAYEEEYGVIGMGE